MKHHTDLTAHPVENILHHELQLFDLKQMVEFEAQYKKQTRQAIRSLKQWRRAYSQQTDMVELLYGNVEGVMLRRRAEDFARLYWLVRCDVRQAMAVYIGRLQTPANYKVAA